MSDVFISYARETAAKAAQVAEGLRALGYSVWRDDELPAHRDYAQVIEERLRAAKAVVVVWSAEAVKSQWVMAEADVAREAGTLVQLSVDGVIPPLPFNRIQCADLAGWAGDAGAPGWRKVADSVASLAAGKGPSGAAAPDPAVRKLSICVLPFANMSDDPQQEYFSDGISEDIITDLSKVSALFIVARNTAFTFKGNSVDVPAVARQLGVSHVLEGSVRKAGGRVRITAQLIDGATGGHVWAERYDRDLTDIFALQDEISQAIVAALKLKLLPEEKKAIEHRGTTSADAYNLYLMARQQLVTGNAGDYRREDAIIRLCSRAVQIDPEYARAWALMAHAQAYMHYNRGKGADDGREAAERALALDSTLAEPHAVRAQILLDSDQIDDAVVEIETAVRLDPDSYLTHRLAGRVYTRVRRLEDAIRHFGKSAALDETDFATAGLLASTLLAVGDAAGARQAAHMTLARVEKAMASDPNNGHAMAYGVGALATLGESERAKEWMERALLIDPDNVLMRYNFACALCVDLHDFDAAIDMLGPVMAEVGIGFVNHAKSDPDFDPIRDDPRFQAMIADAEARLAASADGG